MSFLRHALLPTTIALVAAIAVLFASSASMAYEAPVDQGMATMSMSGDTGPCEPKTVRTVCQKACLVFCQGLIPQADGPSPARVYAPVRYPSLDARHSGFALETEDPPPRT